MYPIYVRGQSTWKNLWKNKAKPKEKNQFNFKDEIYLKMKSVSNMKYLNYVITFPQYFFFF